MNIQLSGVVTHVTNSYFVMIVNEYQSLSNIIDNFGTIQNMPLRANQSAHIWIGKTFQKMIANCKQTPEVAISEFGPFRIACVIKKNSQGSVNITTSGKPVPIPEPT